MTMISYIIYFKGGCLSSWICLSIVIVTCCLFQTISIQELFLGDIHWTVSDLMDVIRGLCVTHLDKLALMPDCELRNSLLPEDKHLCHVNTLILEAPIDILLMRTLLECFPSDSVELETCKILPTQCDADKIVINKSPTEMVISKIKFVI